MQRGEPIDLNFEDLEIEKWNISIEKVEKEYEKNGVICLVIVFTPGVIIITMS